MEDCNYEKENLCNGTKPIVCGMLFPEDVFCR